jgi:hypothetical protein
MLTAKVILNPKANQAGLHGLLLRLTLDRRHKYLHLGIYIKKPLIHLCSMSGKEALRKVPA